MTRFNQVMPSSGLQPLVMPDLTSNERLTYHKAAGEFAAGTGTQPWRRIARYARGAQPYVACSRCAVSKHGQFIGRQRCGQFADPAQPVRCSLHSCSPSNAASVSLTPPDALSRFVCAQIAAAPRRASIRRTVRSQTAQRVKITDDG